MLTESNYMSGFLTDEKQLAGIAKLSETLFSAFIIEDAQLLYSAEFSSLTEALSNLNQRAPHLPYAPISGCGNCSKEACDQQCPLHTKNPEVLEAST